MIAVSFSIIKLIFYDLKNKFKCHTTESSQNIRVLHYFELFKLGYNIGYVYGI